MASVNRIVLVGRLTADPDSRTTLENLPLTRFTLAIDRPPRGDGSREADFIPVVAWRNLAEIAGKYLKKGRLVLIDGRIQNRSYNDPQGERKWVTEVVARNLQMLDKAQASAVPSEEVMMGEDASASALPFDENEYVQ